MAFWIYHHKLYKDNTCKTLNCIFNKDAIHKLKKEKEKKEKNKEKNEEKNEKIKSKKETKH